MFLKCLKCLNEIHVHYIAIIPPTQASFKTSIPRPPKAMNFMIEKVNTVDIIISMYLVYLQRQ